MTEECSFPMKVKIDDDDVETRDAFTMAAVSHRKPALPGHSYCVGSHHKWDIC